jgi:hypothetical protein
LPISRLDPVLVEASMVFVAPSALQVSSRFGTAVSEPVGRGLLLGLAPFRPFALNSKVYDGGHR